MHQLGHHEGGGVEPTDLGEGPPHELAGLAFEDEDVGGGLGGGERQRAGGVEGELRHHAGRHLHAGVARRPGRIGEVQRAPAALVHGEREPAFVLAAGEAGDIPRQVDRVFGADARGEVHGDEPAELAAAVGDGEELVGIGPEDRTRPVLHRAGERHGRELAVGQLEHEDPRLRDGDALANEQLRVVRAPVEHVPLPLHVEHAACRLGAPHVHHPEVEVLAVARGGGVREAPDLVRPRTQLVARLAIGQERGAAGGEVLTEDLPRLGAAGIARVEEAPAIAARVEVGAGHGLREKGELAPIGAGARHAVHLRGFAEAGGDQHLARRGPPEERSAARVVVLRGSLDHRRRDVRNAVDHEVSEGARLRQDEHDREQNAHV